MSTELTCPTCGAVLIGPDEADRAFVCPRCGADVPARAASAILPGPPPVGGDPRPVTRDPDSWDEDDEERAPIRLPADPRRLRGLAAASVGLIGVCVAIVALQLGIEIVRHEAVRPFHGLREIPLDLPDEQLGWLDLLDDASEAAAVVRILAFLASVVVFLFWLHRAFRNLRDLRVRGQSFTPGWAVGWFFVPILNLFRPVSVVQELWRASSPEHAESSVAWQQGSGSPLVLVWWATHIGGGLVGRVADAMMAGQHRRIDDFLAGAKVAMLSDSLTIIAGISLAVIVWRVTARQAERFDVLQDEG